MKLGDSQSVEDAAASENVAKPATNLPLLARSFALSFLVISLVVIAAFAVQKLGPAFGGPANDATYISYGIIGLLVIAGLIFHKFLFYMLTSFNFAISLVLVCAIATIAGTWILQDAAPEDYAHNYGPAFTSAVQFLLLTDIFHSYWFNSLLGLMALSLALVLVKRNPFRLTQVGFLLSHGGIIVVLVGALVGSYSGSKGYINLFEGRTETEMMVMKKGKTTDEMTKMGFSVRLNNFQVEYHKAEWKIYAYEKKTGKDKKEQYETIASIAIKDALKGKKIPGKGIEVKVIEDNTKAAESKHVLAIPASGEKLEVKVGQSYQSGAWKISVLQYFPHFTYSIEEKKAANVDDNPENPALQVLVEKEGTSYTAWLFANMPDYSSQHGGTEQNRIDLIYLFPHPHVVAEVSAPEGLKKVALGEDYGALYLNDKKLAIVLDKRDDEVKKYASDISILESGKEVKRGVVEVNSPLEYNGSMFYQSNYNPRNLSYSGIMVVKDPGLTFVYIGFVMLCAGVVYILYVKPWVLRRRSENAS